MNKPQTLRATKYFHTWCRDQDQQGYYISQREEKENWWRWWTTDTTSNTHAHTHTHHAFMNVHVYYICVNINQCGVCMFYFTHENLCTSILKSDLCFILVFVKYEIFSLNCTLYIFSIAFLYRYWLKWSKHPEMFGWTFYSMKDDKN